MKVLFASLYELITGQNQLADMLFKAEGVYFTVGLVMILLSLVGMAIYYYAINHPKFCRWYHWLLAVIVICLINFSIAYAMADGVVFDTFGTTAGYVTQIVTFGFANTIWTFLFAFIFSMCIKWRSKNAKYSPF